MPEKAPKNVCPECKQIKKIQSEGQNEVNQLMADAGLEDGIRIPRDDLGPSQDKIMSKDFVESIKKTTGYIKNPQK